MNLFPDFTMDSKGIRNKLQQLSKFAKRPRIQQDPNEDSAIQEEINLQADFDHEETIDVENIDPMTNCVENVIENESDTVLFQVGKTNKGGICLWDKGFRYIRRTDVYWRCSNRDCPATAKATIEADGVSQGRTGPKPHNHPPEPQRMEAESRREQMKRNVKDQPHLKPTKLSTQARVTANDEVFVAMGNDQALKKMIFREKNKLFGNINKSDPLSIVFPDELLDKNGCSILIYDSRNTRPTQKDVVLVFSHPTLLEILRNNRRWGGDGTFKAAPKPFVQCFVLAAFVSAQKMVICCHALLPGKNKKYYVEALTALKTALHPVNPYRFISDFEFSLIRAMEEIFPTVFMNGCMFHLSQSLYRKWCKLGLKEYLINQKFRETFRMILSLPLIPAEQVRRAFALIVDLSPAEMADFLLYFAEVYIGFTEVELQLGAIAFEPRTVIRERTTITPNDILIGTPPLMFGQPSPAPSTPTMSTSFESIVQRWELPIVRPPRFEIKFWNLHDQAMNALARTNNAIESSHLQFMKGLVHHPSMSDFILALHEDIDKQVQIARSVAHFSQKRNHRYALQEQHIMTTLLGASYEEDADLRDLLSLLGLQMQGYVSGLREKQAESEEPGSSFVTEEDTENEEESDEEYIDNSSEFYDQ